MPVIFDGYSFRPAPQVSTSTEEQTLGDGKVVGTTTRITITGQIVADKINNVSSPVASDAKLSTILSQQQAIRSACSQSGTFEVIGWNGAVSFSAVAKVVSVAFGEGPWYDTCPYTIIFEAPNINGGAQGENIVEASESWSFQEGESPQTVRVTHRVSAKGRVTPGGNAGWLTARSFVTDKLKVGWTGADGAWSPKSGSTLASESAVAPPSTEEWNRTISEEIDEMNGSYAVEETWILNQENWIEEYKVTTRRVDEPPNTTKIVAIEGTIRGLRKQLYDIDTAFNNAKTRWTAVQSLLAGRAGAGVNTSPTSISVEEDRNAGEVRYQYEFNNRTLVDNTYETWSVSKQSGIEDSYVTVRIDGAIYGVFNLDENSSDTALKLNRAKSRWTAVQGQLLARASAESGISLTAFPANASVTASQEKGTVEYSYEFNNRSPSDVRDEFTISHKYSKEDSKTYITIEGTITGLNLGNDFTASSTLKYDNALAYFTGISTNMLGKAATYVDTTNINTKPNNKTIQHNPYTGTIQYTYEYATGKDPCIPGAISEEIMITDEDSIPVIATITVPGRKRGPIFQDIGTITEKKRTVRIEVLLDPASSPCSNTTPPSVNISVYQPVGTPVYKTQDVVDWTPRSGKYSRSVSWVYTP